MDNTTLLNELSLVIDPFLKSTSYTAGLALFNITTALVMGAVIALIYKRNFQGTLFQRSFAIDLMLASAVTSLIIILISGNLILSLGMVGALSIVRFRTAVKDPSDTIYMFWAIAVGIGSGIGFHKITIAGSFAIFLALEISSRFKISNSSTMIVANCNDSSRFEETLNAIKSIDRNCTVRSESISEEGWELVIDASRSISALEIRQAIGTQENFVDIRCFSYDANV